MRAPRCLLPAVFLFLPGLAASQPAIPLTIENIQTRNRGAFEVALSPDGKWAAIAAEADAGRGIYLVSAEPNGPAVRFLGRGGSPVWTPDGRAVVVSRESDLWTIALDGRETRLTTGPEDERAPAVSPDGRQIAFFSGRGSFQDIWLVPATGGSPRQLTQRAMADDDFRFGPVWSPDGSLIAYISNAADYWADDLWVVETATGVARQLSKGLMASTSPAWSSDGTRLALMSTSKRGYWYEDLADLSIVEVATGAERTVAMQIHASDWLHSQRVVWSDHDRIILFPYLERGDFDLWAVPASGGVATRVTNLGGAIRTIHGSATGDRVGFVRSTETSGPDVFVVEASGGPARQLTRFADTWVGVEAPEEIAFRSYDGLYIQGFLYRPKGMTAGQRYPALVQVHGGGTNSYLKGRNLLEQYLASKGYLVLAINYRGGSGFGRPFQDLSINDWANGQARDAAAAARFLRAQPYSNGKVGIYGYSYGGIMTMAAIAREPNVFDAAVPMAGIYDFGDAYTNADRVGRIFIRTGHGGAPEERPAVYGVSNTLARLRNIETPLLVMHGEADVRAPYRQYLLAVDSLRALGKVFESKSFPGEPHGFRDPAHRVDLYRRLESFLDRHLKAGRAAAAQPDTIPGTAWTEEDWRIFESKVRWGAAHGVDTLPLGKAIARLGGTFVGATYRPATLEVAGPERLVINLRELDCVTFIENVLALTRFIRRDGTGLLADPAAARNRYEGYLRELRYRDGRIDGYPSRLHYFSEWLTDNERRGRVRSIANELGGVADREPIDFMSAHPKAYRQLADSGVLEAIRATEARLNASGPRWFLPEAAIAGAAPRIQDGDLIAATSTLPGLDVAHTGFALWRNGRLHLLHAPLVGKSVEISRLPLAERIRSIANQGGIMVARPIERPAAGSATSMPSSTSSRTSLRKPAVSR